VHHRPLATGLSTVQKIEYSFDTRFSPFAPLAMVQGKPEKMKTELRRILAESARLDVSIDTLSDSDDLYAAGLSSLATVHVMLAIEDEFGIEIPDQMLTRRLFSSVDSLAAAVKELQGSQADA
jgi:acyl carrier protein